jgi:hypothetical protein
LNMAAVTPKVASDLVCTCNFRDHRCCHRIWVRRLPRLAKGCDVINVYTESARHGPSRLLRRRSYHGDGDWA